MLPPMLYPQAIQIGRLLDGCEVELLTVSGRFTGLPQDSRGFNFRQQQIFIKRIELGHKTALGGIWHRLAMRLVPFYGRAPDEFKKWAKLAAQEIITWLASPSNSIDLMATFGEPMSDHLVGLAVKKRYAIPWLVHFSDPWADNPFRRFQPLANWRNRQLERMVIEHADSVVFTSEETRKLVMKKYPSKWMDKTFILPHSFDPNQFKQSRGSGQPHQKLIIRYLGNFYGHRTPFPLISALARMSKKTPDLLEGVRFEIVGSLPNWMRLHPSLRRLPEGLLEFFSSVNYSDSLGLMTSSDLLLVIDAPAKESVFLPSKLVDYIGAGKPIFGIVPPGASKSLIERLGGLTANPQNLDEIECKLTEAIDQARSVRSASKDWGVEEVRGQFKTTEVVAKFREILSWTRNRAL